MNEPRPPRVLPATLTPEMRDADEWAEQLIAEQLPRTRALAAQWGATLAALTALFGAGIVIDADDAVRALDPEGWGIAYGILTAGAVLAAAIAILLAAQAAHGSLSTIPPDVAERVALRRRLVAEAQRNLQWSRRAAAVAVLLLIASFGVRWYAPHENIAARDGGGSGLAAGDAQARPALLVHKRRSVTGAVATQKVGPTRSDTTIAVRKTRSRAHATALSRVGPDARNGRI